jgi:hypothetical protein
MGNPVHVIVAPHCDDELIGCYEIIIKKEPTAIVFTGEMSRERQEEALKLREEYENLSWYFFNPEVPPGLIDKENTYYFPDPIYEIHPLHRYTGSLGEILLRRHKLNVKFYVTRMNAPYIHEVPDSIKKKELLDKIYPSQKSLWEMDHGLYLFEGRCIWEM